MHHLVAALLLIKNMYELAEKICELVGDCTLFLTDILPIAYSDDDLLPYKKEKECPTSLIRI